MRLLTLSIVAGVLTTTGLLHAAEPRTPFRRVEIAPFVITSSTGGPARPALTRRLAEAAADRAGRTLIQQRIAGEVRRLGSREDPRPDADGIISGTVRLPVPLPPGQGGARAAFRKGTLATVSVRVERPGGQVLAEEQASLGWKEVRWVRGARLAVNRPSDDVLEDAVRKVVDRAVQKLEKKIPR